MIIQMLGFLYFLTFFLQIDADMAQLMQEEEAHPLSNQNHHASNPVSKPLCFNYLLMA